jgi:predicted TIM-barrel fold metal-dependent hydrolase
MGLAKGIFVVDTHVHAQRHAFRFKAKGEDPDYAKLSGGMAQIDAYDNSPRLLYHMDRYGIDVCVIQPAFGMTNEIDVEIMEKHPDRFVAFCRDVKTQHKALREGVKWSIQDAVKEIDELLSTGLYKGIGESIPRSRQPERKRLTWDERLDEICQIMELARKYKVAVSYHTGFPSGYGADLDRGRAQGHYETVESANPLLCHEVAALYPDVPIILAHAGIEGSGYYTEYYEKSLNVAASHHNVYLECGQWWAELYEKPLKDPNIGCEKLIWGTDWGASCVAQSWMPGCVPETYCNQDIKLGPPAHQIDIWGWSLRELGRLNIPQDDLNLIMGGNAVRLFGIKTPFTRLFKDYPKKQK